jgi:tetratricopeptide (TPR) repeat protein
MRRFLFLLVIFFPISLLNSQEKDTQEPRDMFLEAESYLLYEEYTEALPLYLKLVKADPENDNLNYKAGLCYLNVPYEKERSITYLEKAVKNINIDYKINNFKERKAPLDALFYLGSAYRINNQLDKAIETYEDFRNKLDREIYDIDLVNEQIEAIERAKKYQAKPIYYISTNLGEPINSRFSESNAVVSGDESTLVYNVKLQFYDALFFSKWTNGKWSAPINIIPDLGVDGDVYATGLSYNGKELFIYRSDKFDGNIYVSRFINDRWTPIVRLNDNINTKYWESHASVSADSKTLIFTSNRKGSYGGLDIFSATRTDTNTNDWTNVKNIGPDVNSPYNEETPFLSQDGKVLYFSSYGHFNMGGYDIFYSSLLDNDKWSAPLNMGYPLNTTDDDIFFAPVQNGNFAYITRYYPDNFGKNDIYKIELFSSQHPRKFVLKGLISITGDMEEGDNGQLTAILINKTTKDTVKQLSFDLLKPSFITNLTAGKYRLFIQGDGFQKSYEDFNIDINQSSDEVTVNAKLKAMKKQPAQPVVVAKEIGKIVFDRSFYKVITDKPISIKLNLEPGDKVEVSIYHDTSFISKETIAITSQEQVYNYTPVPGKNLLKFKSVSADNTIKEGEVVIYYEPDNSLQDKILALELARKKAELTYTKNIISYFTAGSLKDCLESIDIEKEKLTSLTELIDFISTQTDCKGLDRSKIDSIFNKYKADQQVASKMLIDALSELSSGKLKSTIDSIKDKNQITDVIQLTDALQNAVVSDKEQRDQLLVSSARLAWEGNVYYYLNNLKKVSNGNLKNTLDKINLTSDSITSVDDLLNYLLKQAKDKDYTEKEVFDAFFSIPLFATLPVAVLDGMIAVSDTKTKDFLEKEKTFSNQIKTNNDLKNHLWEQAQNENISTTKILEALIKAGSIQYYSNLINDVKHFASGDLKKLIDFALSDKTTVNSVAELLNYIMSKDDSVHNSLTKLFLHVASKNMLKMNNFNPQKEEKNYFTASNIVFATFVLILLIALIFIFRRLASK